MMMRAIMIAIMAIGISFFYSCENEDKRPVHDNITTEKPVDKIDSISIELTKCDCLDPKEEYKAICETRFKDDFSAREKFDCTGDSTYLDTIPAEEQDSIRSAYEEDLSLEIKEIEEEKEEPISEECKAFLQDYAEAIKDFKSLSDRVDAHPDDIALKISYKTQSEDLESWASNPQMFRCSQNEAFKKQVEILNEKKERLINGE